MKFLSLFWVLFFIFAGCSSSSGAKGDSDQDNDTDFYEDTDLSEDGDVTDDIGTEDKDVIPDDTDILNDEDPDNDDDPEDGDATDDDETEDDEDVFDDSDHVDDLIQWRGDTASVTVTGDDLRTYTLSTTASLRDNLPPSKQRVVTEKEGDMILRSGHTFLDALFAMTIEEVLENSVTQINDWSFDNGNPVDCDCFETGEKWKYVWTRDTAYAVDLGLALVDPERSRNSLEFKISDRKDSVGGGNMEIIQDTGTGGSWPVSTDRVSWALGAYETLKFLNGISRSDFLDKAYAAIKNTILTDRKYVFDENDGLYKGEQSFLDWREQTYPVWTADDTVHIAMSKVLSTNVLHYIILDVGSKLAEMKEDVSFKNDCINWKSELRQKIRQNFYLEDAKLFATMKTTYLNDHPVEKYDLLGQSLAVLSGVANDTQAKESVRNYPVTEAGPPVIWPQEPFVRVYHNRGIWPFVTAYALRSAIQADNDAAVNNAFMSLVRGAALNLSNMENFEFTTLANWYEDTRKDHYNRDLSGPVVNSRRQLWSVAAFVSLVTDGLFGMEFTLDGVNFEPKLTALIRNEIVPGSEEIVLKNVPFRGKKMDVKLVLPKRTSAKTGFFVKKSLKLNGSGHSGIIPHSSLMNENTIEIELEYSDNTDTLTKKNCDDEAVCFAPRAPNIPLDPYGVAVNSGKLQVTFNSPDTGVTFNMYRDGVKVAQNATSPWIDDNSGDFADKSYCYSVTALNSEGNESHIANPVCYWGNEFDRIAKLEPVAFEQSGSAFMDHGRMQFGDWGLPGAELSVSSFSPDVTGKYLIQIEYGSGRPIDTGITACFKEVEITDLSDNSKQHSFVVMPHLGLNDWGRWGNSSFGEFHLDSSKTYRIVIKDTMNMSYFKHFVPYTGHPAGGGNDVYNRANVSTLKFLLKEKNL
jgi:hypothetical protein